MHSMSYSGKLLLYFLIPCLIWGTLFLLSRFGRFSIEKARISVASYLVVFVAASIVLLFLKQLDPKLDLIVLGSLVAGVEWFAWRERRSEKRRASA